MPAHDQSLLLLSATLSILRPLSADNDRPTDIALALHHLAHVVTPCISGRGKAPHVLSPIRCQCTRSLSIHHRRTDQYGQAFDGRLQGLLSELEAGMGSALLRGSDPNGRPDTGGAKDRTVLTPRDEFQYWADCAVAGTQLLERWVSK